MKSFLNLVGERFSALFRYLKWVLSAVSTAGASLLVLYLESTA